MPLIETKGAASAQGFGLTLSSGAVPYIEDVFSTYLYTGNGSTQTITNGIDLSGKGGLVWSKSRSVVQDHSLIDTVRGNGSILYSNLTNAADTGVTTGITAFNTTGYALGSASFINQNTQTYASWTFREQPKFFDVVTFTSSASGNKTFSHNLGAVPGCVIIKNTQTSDPWLVYHRSVGDNAYLQLNSTAAQDPLTGAFSATSTTFTISSSLMYNSQTYVAYLFAHDAGGFGLSGTDNVISCGSYTGNGLTDGPVINLSYEPQWVMIKRTDSTGNWALIDNMRGFPDTGSAGNYDNGLLANTSGAETTTSLRVKPTSTGFSPVGGDAGTNASGGTYIYIAIRRGPMKVPTSGTSVFGLNARSGSGANATVTGSAGVSDAVLIKNRGSAVGDLFASRLTGTGYLETSSTAAEVAAGTTVLQANPWDVMDGVNVGTTSTITNASSNTFINYLFGRAPGFFDEVCYTASLSTGTAIAHNLQAAPELVICKSRGAGALDCGWMVWSAYTSNKGGYLNTTAAFSNGFWASGISPTATSVYADYQLIGGNNSVTEVAYLFATCAGVSKVGSYTGTGALQTVNCGFTGGARLVLIKRTDSTGGWYIYDSARGISSGNDPYLLLNSTAAEVTGTNYVDTTSVGFQVTAAAPAELNANGGTYIFLAIA